MKTLSVAEAKRRFSELIDRVARGERFVVARRGEPAVGLVPPTEIGEPSRPSGGLLALIGTLADVEGFDDTMREVVSARRRARDRQAPKLR